MTAASPVGQLLEPVDLAREDVLEHVEVLDLLLVGDVEEQALGALGELLRLALALVNRLLDRLRGGRAGGAGASSAGRSGRSGAALPGTGTVEASCETPSRPPASLELALLLEQLRDGERVDRLAALVEALDRAEDEPVALAVEVLVGEPDVEDDRVHRPLGDHQGAEHRLLGLEVLRGDVCGCGFHLGPPFRGPAAAAIAPFRNPGVRQTTAADGAPDRFPLTGKEAIPVRARVSFGAHGPIRGRDSARAGAGRPRRRRPGAGGGPRPWCRRRHRGARPDGGGRRRPRGGALGGAGGAALPRRRAPGARPGPPARRRLEGGDRRAARTRPGARGADHRRAVARGPRRLPDGGRHGRDRGALPRVPSSIRRAAGTTPPSPDSPSSTRSPCRRSWSRAARDPFGMPAGGPNRELAEVAGNHGLKADLEASRDRDRRLAADRDRLADPGGPTSPRRRSS